MVRAIGWPPDAYKMPNKPTEQGLQFHCLTDHGNICSFHSLEPGKARVERIRKRLGKKSTNAKKTREAFRDAYEKGMSTSLYIEDYNQHMGGVDVADRFRFYNDTQLTHFEPGGPCFSGHTTL